MSAALRNKFLATAGASMNASTVASTLLPSTSALASLLVASAAHVGVGDVLHHQPPSSSSSPSPPSSSSSSSAAYFPTAYGDDANSSAAFGDGNASATSLMEEDEVRKLWAIYESYKNDMNVGRPTAAALMVAYAVLVLVGTTGNGLVVTAVVRKASMRTPRNLFIFNLAVSDIILCVVTMPFTLVEIVYNNWKLGEFFCKLAGILEPTSIFVSTLSITVIAVDRCYIILNPTKASVQQRGALIITASIWAFSIVCGIPLFVNRRLHVFDVKLPDLETLPLCMEQWTHPLGRGYYSLASMIFIYLIPITTVTLAYKKICVKLRNRLGNKIMNKTSTSRKAQMEDQKITRTNKLLASMAIAFCCSWFPLNFLNVLDDFDVFSYPSRSVRFTVFAVCHMVGMLSACVNPILYGYLNENFRKEFREMYIACLGSRLPKREKSLDSKRSTWIRETTNNMDKGDNGAPVGNGAGPDGVAGAGGASGTAAGVEVDGEFGPVEVEFRTSSGRIGRGKKRFRIFDSLQIRRNRSASERDGGKSIGKQARSSGGAAGGNHSKGSSHGKQSRSFHAAGGSSRRSQQTARSAAAAAKALSSLPNTASTTTTATRFEMGPVSYAASNAADDVSLLPSSSAGAGGGGSSMTLQGQSAAMDNVTSSAQPGGGVDFLVADDPSSLGGSVVVGDGGSAAALLEDQIIPSTASSINSLMRNSGMPASILRAHQVGHELSSLLAPAFSKKRGGGGGSSSSSSSSTSGRHQHHHQPNSYQTKIRIEAPPSSSVSASETSSLLVPASTADGDGDGSVVLHVGGADVVVVDAAV